MEARCGFINEVSRPKLVDRTAVVVGELSCLSAAVIVDAERVLRQDARVVHKSRQDERLLISRSILVCMYLQ